MKDIIKNDVPEQAGVKKKKRKNKSNLSLYYALIALIVIIVGVILSLTVLFEIDKIVVNGDVPYNSADIIEASGVKLGENIIRADYSQAEKRVLDTLLLVETVKVEKKFPTTIVITVTESKPCYNIESEDGYIITSESGKIIDFLKTPISGLMTVFGIDAKSTEPFEILKDKESNKADIILAINKAIDKSEIDGIISINIEDKYNITLNFEDRIEVRIGNSANIDYKIQYVKSVFESNKISSQAQGYLIIDDNGEGHFVNRDSMDEYEENKNNLQSAVPEDEISDSSGEDSSSASQSDIE